MLPINPIYSKQTFSILLTGIRYKVNVRWNTRDESWYIGLLTAAGILIFSPVKILPGWVPFRQLKHEKKPVGNFVIIDTITENVPPGRLELGTDERVKVLYIDSILE